LSSILKALKKLENKFPEQNRILFRPQKRRITQVIYQRLKVLRFSSFGFLLVFSFITLVIGGWLILKSQNGNKEPESIAKTEIKPEKTFGISEKMPSNKQSPQKNVTSPMNNIKSLPVPQTEKKPPLSALKVQKKILPSDKKTKIEPSKILNIPEKPFPPDRSHKEKTDKIAIEKNTRNTKAELFDSIPVKQVEESRLELQAIAWSTDPKSRIAVINNKIIREGGSVAGVIVTHIGKDDVVFKKGKEEWRQQLGFTKK